MRNVHTRTDLGLLIILTITITSCVLLNVGQPVSASSRRVDITVDEQRKSLGETRLKEVERKADDRKADDSECWKKAVSRLNSTCRQLTDTEQSRLAVAFANCHLHKSARQTYPCDDTMTVKECTQDMDPVAFQTYTEFFTHTGHICYFLQTELWQERTENVIGRLSDTSSEAVEKLELALEYHREMDHKQTVTLNNQETILEQDRKIAASLQDTHNTMNKAFGDMAEMAEKQKVLLNEMFGTLQGSVDTIRYLMSLLLVEFIGYETFVALGVAWLVVIFLPQFGHSRFKLHLVLFANLALEIVVRRVYGYFVLSGGGGSSTPPENLSGLHSWLWRCRYTTAVVGIIVYVWEWYSYTDQFKKHVRMLEEIKSQNEQILGALGKHPSRHSWPAASRVNQLSPHTHTYTHTQIPVPTGSHPDILATPRTHLHPHHSDQPDIPTMFPHNLQRRVAPDSGGREEEEGVDGSMLGLLRSIPIPGRHSDPYEYFDRIAGLPPPIGHPDSSYTDSHVREYIRSLPVLHRIAADQSSSMVVEPESSCGSSDDTFVSPEDPLQRTPIRIKNTGKKNTPTASTPRREAKKPAKGRSRRVTGDSTLSNIPLDNRLMEEREKEVAEEKEERGRGRGRERGRESRSRTSSVRRERASLTPSLSHPHPITSPSNTRYNLRPRRGTPTPTH